MPRARLNSSSVGLPLSVTAVSSRLGVSASTLRTWERRYGLGPEERQAGAHRRYRPEDVARLSRMVDLIRSGVVASDAAAMVLAMDRSVLVEPSTGEAPTSPAQLVEAARSGQTERLRRLVETAVSADGLVHTFSTLVVPAMDTILGSTEGEIPGYASSALLVVTVFDLLRSMAEQGPREIDPSLPGVAILVDPDHLLDAHVVGVALQWNGISASITSAGLHDGTSGMERFEALKAKHRISIVVIMGRGASCEHLISSIARDEGLEVVLVGVDSPAYLDRHVERVRTLSACVDETISLVRSPARREDPNDEELDADGMPVRTLL